MEGLARLLDVGNTLCEYNFYLSGIDSDLEAIRGDWRQVGNDLSEATRSMKIFTGETAKKIITDSSEREWLYNSGDGRSDEELAARYASDRPPLTENKEPK